MNQKLLAFLVVWPCISFSQTTWKQAEAPIKTRWAAAVNQARALPEYPRPQMVRASLSTGQPGWQNLNGLWDYAITDTTGFSNPGKTLRAAPVKWDGRILVPYPLESALSGW